MECGPALAGPLFSVPPRRDCFAVSFFFLPNATERSSEPPQLRLRLRLRALRGWLAIGSPVRLFCCHRARHSPRLPLRIESARHPPAEKPPPGPSARGAAVSGSARRGLAGLRQTSPCHARLSRMVARAAG